MALIGRPDAGGVLLVTLDWRIQSTHSEQPREPNGSISWGLLFKPHGHLKLTPLAICVDIANL